MHGPIRIKKIWSNLHNAVSNGSAALPAQWQPIKQKGVQPYEYNGNTVKCTTDNGLEPTFGYIRIAKVQKLTEWYLYG